jgi:ATP/maltotriose-dependent transcriptional regulator MalT/DNA-binding SARP family transcriptional activator
MAFLPSAIVEARLARPRLPRILKRRRLLDRLLTGVPHHPLTLVSAGAGYGKTTLLASMADQYPAGILWYSLGSEDADLQVFLSHIAASLRRYSRRFGRGLTALLEEGGFDPRAANSAAGVFLNDLSRIREPLAFVLDDFHLVAGNRELIKFLSIVLEGNKSAVRFVLASRSEPPLPLGRLRARRQVLEIGPEDLAFTPDELRHLLEEVYEQTPSEDDLALVAQFTEGWVTPIQLALQASSDPSAGDLSQALRRATRSGSALHDYLAEEVLNLESADRRRWMLLTSAFEELDARLLEAVLNEGDSETRLLELVARNLIHAFEGAEGAVFRYHTLLRDFLARRYALEVPADERRELHMKAADVYLSRGDLVNAARQLALAEDEARFAAFLGDNALRLLDMGQYQALLTWLGRLSAATLDREPWLRLRLGDCRHYLGDWPGAEIEYEKAQMEFQRVGHTEGEAWATLGLARIWNLRGQAERSVAEGERALARIETGKGKAADEIRSRLLQVTSGAQFYLGHYAEALGLLDRLETLSRGNPDRQSAIWNNRAVLLASQGNYQAAARAFERGLQRPGARRSPRAPLHLSNLALLLNEMGDTERAQPLFHEALELARASQNRSQILSCLLGQAHLLYRLGQVDRCLELVREAEELNSEIRVPLIESDGLALKAQILADAGQFPAAREALSQALAAYGAQGKDANWLLYRVRAAVVDLRAGRTTEAHQQLTELLPIALELEALFPRTLLFFYLGEAERSLGAGEAGDYLERALATGRELGYDSFFRIEMRRNFDPFDFLLRAGREAAYISRLAAGAGSPMEQVFLDFAGVEGLPLESIRAILSVLSEIGGPASHRRLSTSSWMGQPELSRAVRSSLEQLEKRYPELKSAPGAAKKAGRGFYLATLGRLSLSGPQGEIATENWKSQRALSIFVYLALRAGRGVTKERLIDLFWPGNQERHASKNFHPTLSYARRALRDQVEGPIFQVNNGLYQLDPDLAITVDVRRFEALVADARNRSRRSEKLPAFEEALHLYKGDFLEDRYEAWAEEIRTQLASQYESVLAEAAELYREGRDHARAITLYKALAGRNPYHEETHVKLMMCYHQSGDRQAIRKHYDGLTRILRDELNVEPLPETASAYERLVAGP